MDFTGNSQPTGEDEEPNFTKPAKQHTPLEENRDEAPEAEERPRPARRARIATPRPTTHIRTINTADWKQQQVTGWKRT